MTRAEAFDTFLIALRKVKDPKLMREIGDAARCYASAAAEDVIMHRRSLDRHLLDEVSRGN